MDFEKEAREIFHSDAFVLAGVFGVIPLVEAALRRAYEAGGGGQWVPGSQAPTDGRHILGSVSYRYLHYKPDGRRQMKAEGRWQRATEYGWENCGGPPEWWMPNIPCATATRGMETPQTATPGGVAPDTKEG